MQEWLNWLAWKASIPQKGIGGSNPPLSANYITPFRCKAEGFLYFKAERTRLAGVSDDLKYKYLMRLAHQV